MCACLQFTVAPHNSNLDDVGYDQPLASCSAMMYAASTMLNASGCVVFYAGVSVGSPSLFHVDHAGSIRDCEEPAFCSILE